DSRVDVDEQLGLGIKLALVRQALKPDLVQRLSNPTKTFMVGFIYHSVEYKVLSN
ncbi:hypothetical protein BIFBRE_05085, partial [Bifidobacterium breve DSM 20213 = JCM 1192]